MTWTTTATSIRNSAPWTISTRSPKAAHADGIKIVVDIVPNHSSNLHEWFKAALAAKPGSLERDRYIFRDGKGPNGDEPPTNWQNHFGGPAWTRVPDGQWYLHMFTKEQPDWNWKNEDVRADFIKTLRFWLDHGADGFPRGRGARPGQGSRSR